ncbi:MAG: VacJ family lipoprotein [Desulfovibrionaceae bacterium]
MYKNNFFVISPCVVLLCSLCLLGACASKKTDSPAVPASTSQHTEGQDDTSSSNARPSRMMTSIPASSESVYPHRQNSSVEEPLDDYDAPVISISDPLEPWNRFWFKFNDIFYLYVARPLYTGYAYVTPSEFRTGLKNLLSNLLFPIRFINALLQGKPNAAGVEFGRFMINTTVGFGGLIDVAKGAKAIVPVDASGEDFGQTLGVWGIGQGLYVVWPIIGPSSARDSVGLAADCFLDPTYYLQPWEAAFAVSGGLRFNTLDDILTLYEDINKSAVDPYVAMREAYATYRQLRLQQ